MEAIGIPIPSDRSTDAGPSSPGGTQSQSFSGRSFNLGNLMRRPRSGTTGNLGASTSSSTGSGGPAGGDAANSSTVRGNSMLRGFSYRRDENNSNGGGSPAAVSAGANGNSNTGGGGGDSARQSSNSRGRSHSLSHSVNAAATSSIPRTPLSPGLPTQVSPAHSRNNSAPNTPHNFSAQDPISGPSSSSNNNNQPQTSNSAATSSNTDRFKPFHVRLVPHLELSSRSLHFEPSSRIIKPGHTLKIGRFNERSSSHSQATNANALDCNRVAFKSKVVSRQHAEFYLEAKEDGSPGTLWVKDTKSSSGSFLNHIRLSGPGLESRLFQVRDGDVFQLGVDYQGGTQEMYRCVKMRVEINRNVQKGASQFNVQALKRALGNAGAALPSPATQTGTSTQSNKSSSKPPQPAPTESTDCCICLFAVSVCQALFIAPCSHVYHYKCIRPLLQMHHPGFSCPLCRTFADLDADVDDDQLLDENIGGSESSEEDVLPVPTTDDTTDAAHLQSSLENADTEDPQLTMSHSAAAAPSGSHSTRSRRSSLHSRRAHGSSSHLSSMHASNVNVPDAGEFEAEMRRASLSVAGPHGHSAALGQIPVTGRSSRPGSVRNVELGSQTPNSERRSLIHLPSMDEIASPLFTPSPREEGPPPDVIAAEREEEEGGGLSRQRTYVEPEQLQQQQQQEEEAPLPSSQ